MSLFSKSFFGQGGGLKGVKIEKILEYIKNLGAAPVGLIGPVAPHFGFEDPFHPFYGPHAGEDPVEGEFETSLVFDLNAAHDGPDFPGATP